MSGNGNRRELVAAGLKTPGAAAVAGILFAVLMIAALVLLRLAVPGTLAEEGRWLQTGRRQVVLALNLVPFAGIAFLWFLGVLRDKLGAREDKFFATVFLGSGLMFLGMLFVSAAAVGGVLLASNTDPTVMMQSQAFGFARGLSYELMHVYAFRMAAVFMISTSTLAVRIGFVPRWIALLGYLGALTIMFLSSAIDTVVFGFPLWVLLVSTSILIENYRRPAQPV